MYQRIKKSISTRYANHQYTRMASHVSKHAFDYEHLKEEGFYSQCGQDKWVTKTYFPDKLDGVFVDIGAHDGISFSNTYYLEQLGWTGLAVEPLAEMHKKLALSRSCISVNGCIAEQSGQRKFRKIEGYAQMLSGLVDEYEPRHLERIEHELATHGGSYEDITVECFNFNDLITDNGLNKIDYLSVDVEGVELRILQSIDFDVVDIGVIGVENNYSDYRIPKLLNKAGFDFHSIVGDEFYVNRKFKVPRV